MPIVTKIMSAVRRSLAYTVSTTFIVGRRIRSSLLPAGQGMLAAAIVALSGCVAVVPLPPTSRKPTAGRVLTNLDVAFIETGRTTKSEIERRLGPCTRDFPQRRVLAYTWETPGWRAWWLYSVPNSAAMGISDSADRWRALFVAFDEQGRVQKKLFRKLSHRRSLDQEAARWPRK